MGFRYAGGTTTVKTRILAEKHSPYKKNIGINNVQGPIINAPPEVRRIIERVLQTEKDKLYMKRPHHINDDILRIIKEEVQ